jgi:hypothetical protein
MQADVSLTRFAERLPEHRVAQLAVQGERSPLGTLQSLAADTTFRGTVICDIVPPAIHPSRWRDQQVYYTHRPSRSALLDTFAHCALQNSLALFDPRLNLLDRTVGVYLGLPSPAPRFAHVRLDRALECDFSRHANVSDYRHDELARIRAVYRDSALCDLRELSEAVPVLTECVRRIQRRGGHVVFVRLPSARDRLEVEETNHPQGFWNKLLPPTGAVCVDFQQNRSWSRFELPDDSHLDVRSTPAFTDALLDELIRQKVFAAPEASGALEPDRALALAAAPRMQPKALSSAIKQLPEEAR